MIRGKTTHTSVMHDPAVFLPHEKDAVQKNRSQPRWVACQSVNPNAVSAPVHELDRASAFVGNDPGVLDEEVAADEELQEQQDRDEAISKR